METNCQTGTTPYRRHLFEFLALKESRVVYTSQTFPTQAGTMLRALIDVVTGETVAVQSVAILTRTVVSGARMLTTQVSTVTLFEYRVQIVVVVHFTGFGLVRDEASGGNPSAAILKLVVDELKGFAFLAGNGL